MCVCVRVRVYSADHHEVPGAGSQTVHGRETQKLPVKIRVRIRVRVMSDGDGVRAMGDGDR